MKMLNKSQWRPKRMNLTNSLFYENLFQIYFPLIDRNKTLVNFVCQQFTISESELRSVGSM